MSRELVNSIKQSKDKELAIVIYKELKSDVRHYESTSIGLATLAIALAKFLAPLLALIGVFFICIALVKLLTEYRAKERLIREVEEVLSMSLKELKNRTWPWIVIYCIGMIALALVMILSNL